MRNERTSQGPNNRSIGYRTGRELSFQPVPSHGHFLGQLAQAPQDRGGGKRKPYHKKRKYELGRPAANTEIGPRCIHTVRMGGGNKKYRALRLDMGNFSWGSECCTCKTRIMDVVYNAPTNELV